MNKLRLELQNCYGIKKLYHEFNYEKSNVNVVYARNGLMKTSLTKSFKSIQDNKTDLVCDEIFGCTPTILSIKRDGQNISKDEVFVIKSFENSYESDNVASLLVDNTMKDSLKEIFVARKKLLEEISKLSGIKLTKTVQGKKILDLEPKVMQDLGFEESSILLNINNIDIDSLEVDFSSIYYSNIFDPTVVKKIRDIDFQNKINDFLKKSDEIYTEYSFFDKGKFTLPKLKQIQKELKKSNFFVKNNGLSLAGNENIGNLTELNSKIKDIENNLQSSNEFKAIEAQLSDAKGIILKDILENNPHIIEELKIDKLDGFKKKLWLSYFKKNQDKYDQLKVLYQKLETQIANADFDKTPWQEALNIFNSRFSVPFCMDIDNLKSAIIGESLPKIVFSFFKDGDKENLSPENCKTYNRVEMETKDTLSQGERRALYLLNIIFDLEKIRRDGKEILIIIDDIADSFDYKNKYSIIEYLSEMAENSNFNLLILSHNFDFYRTVCSRLDMPRDNKYFATRRNEEIVFEVEHYQKQPFDVWKKELNLKNTIALIPLVRNLIEYGVDKNINDYQTIDKDYDLLTNVLHLKADSKKLSFDVLQLIYKEYIGNDSFIDNIDSHSIIDSIYTVASTITVADTKLENKIILSMATRLKAEEYMIKEIGKSNIQFTWRNGKSIHNGNSTDYLHMVSTKGNQTRKLYEGFSQLGMSEEQKIMESVNIMTPESIHLNSFMYEPILDLDIVELKNIYDRISTL